MVMSNTFIPFGLIIQTYVIQIYGEIRISTGDSCSRIEYYFSLETQSPRQARTNSTARDVALKVVIVTPFEVDPIVLVPRSSNPEDISISKLTSSPPMRRFTLKM